MTDRIGSIREDERSAAPQRRSEREFARARRHSRMVRLLRIGLPAAALAMVLVGVGVVFLARALPGNVSVLATSIEDGRIVMQDPRMSGSDSQDRPYSMIARRAIQSLTGSGIDLEDVRAELPIDDRTNASVNAASGRYDPDAESLRLFDDIEVNTTDGMSIRMSEAQIDFAGGRMEGQGPVFVTTASQRLESGSVTVEDGGSRLSFGNRVKLTILPSALEGDTASE